MREIKEDVCKICPSTLCGKFTIPRSEYRPPNCPMWGNQSTADKWRPPNWENPYNKYPHIKDARNSIFEAGADAMLKAVNEHMNQLPDFDEWASQWARDEGWTERR